MTNDLFVRALNARRRAWACAVSLLAMGLASGCYNPNVAPGTLHCAAKPAKQCPDGLTCVGDLCQASGTAGTAGRGAGGAGGAGGSGGAGGATCAQPIAPLCSPPPNTAGVCDPVCQTGCACGLRCNVTSSAGCGPVLGQKALGQICAPESDECAPGLVCLKEPCGNNLGRCYRFCRDNGACGPGGVCGTPINLPGGVSSGAKACNVADQTPACDVFARTGCPDPAFVCYVASGQNTKCDCPSPANRAEGQSCAFYNDCAPGLTCLSLGGASQCYKLCRNSSDCTGGRACTISGSSGYCS